VTKISVRGLEQEYGGKLVLERINLEVEEGEYCTVVGASGCGKSTFLRLLLSQEPATRGEILIDGKPIAREPGPDRGIVFQRYSVFPHLTVMDNVIFPLETAKAPVLGRTFGARRRKLREHGEEMLENVGLLAARDLCPKALSGGMQQRLAIAQALIRRPEILLLDEPFGALDPGTRANMHRLMLDLWRRFRITVFMVTHDIQEGFKLGTRLLVFDKVRWDDHAPERYGATITYDLPLKEYRDSADLPTIETGPPERGPNAETQS
jgi:NitT/TauT family transport system ATP-binding protein